MFRRFAAAALVSALAATVLAQGALRILVLEGEDAVNLIDKKTAVKPTVEVRDRNDLPVSGATVVFLIRGRGATFANGARQVTLTTDTLGRATVSELTPVGKGAVNIQVQASYQGQSATATIHQTNFATAADAAKAQGSSTASTTTAAAATTGGGLSGGVLAGIAAGSAAAAAASANAVANRRNQDAPATVPSPIPPGFATVSVAAPESVVPTTNLDPARCAIGQHRFLWLWTLTFTESGGVAVQFTSAFFSANGVPGAPGPSNFRLAARSTLAIQPSVCAFETNPSPVTITYNGTDENGHAVAVTTPVVRLVAAAGALTTQSAAPRALFFAR